MVVCANETVSQYKHFTLTRFAHKTGQTDLSLRGRG